MSQKVCALNSSEAAQLRSGATLNCARHPHCQKRKADVLVDTGVAQWVGDLYIKRAIEFIVAREWRSAWSGPMKVMQLVRGGGIRHAPRSRNTQSGRSGPVVNIPITAVLLLACIFLPQLHAQTTATVTGKIVDAGGAGVSVSAFVRFELRNCSDQPRVLGVGVIVKSKDFRPDVSGNISGTIYRNDAIDCNGTKPSEWAVTYYQGGSPGKTKGYTISTGAFDLTNAVANNTTTPPPAPVLPYIVSNPLVSQVITQPAATSFTVGGGNGFDLGASTLTGLLQRANGGLGNATFSLNSAIYFDGTKFVSALPAGSGTLAWCKTDDGVPFWGVCTVTGSGTPLISNTANPATVGAIRLASSDAMNFKKNDLSGNINGLSKNTLDQMLIGGTPGAILSGPLTVPSAILTGTVTAAGFISASVGAASSGIVRLANGELIAWGAGTHTFTYNGTLFALTDSLAIGAIHASIGTIQLPSGASIAARSADNLFDQVLASGDADNYESVAGGNLLGLRNISGTHTSPQGVGISIIPEQGSAPIGRGVSIGGSNASGNGDTGGTGNLFGGDAVGANGNGGDVAITPGAKAGAGTNGTFRIRRGVNADESGYKHKRFGATCTTGAVAGNTCTTTFSWVTALADANYTPVCWGVNPTGTPILTLSATQIAGSITVKVITATAVASSFAGVYCQVAHD